MCQHEKQDGMSCDECQKIVVAKMSEVKITDRNTSNTLTYRAWDIEGQCWIPPELICVAGDGTIFTRDSVDGEWIEETIPISFWQVSQ